MCYGCYEEYGKPQIISPETIAASGLIRRVYDFNGVGGNLHAQLDDWNIEDEFFDEFKVFNETTPEQLVAEQACFNAMRTLTIEQRASALALYDGWLLIDGEASSSPTQSAAVLP